MTMRSLMSMWPWLFAILFLIMLVGSYFLPPDKARANAEFTFTSSVGNATVLPKPKVLNAALHLQDHNKQALGLKQLQGRWTFLFFGYTSCPDVCPLQMHTLKRISDKLVADKIADDKKPRVILVSIDPERDTPEKLKAYVQQFDKDFMGASGSAAETERFAAELGIYYKPVPVDEKGQVDHSKMDHSKMDHAKADNSQDEQVAKITPVITADDIDHTSSLILLNPKAEFAALFSAPHKADEIAKVYNQIIDRH